MCPRRWLWAGPGQRGWLGGSQSGRKSAQERNPLCPARTSQEDASGLRGPVAAEEEGYSRSNGLSWTFSSGDGVSGQWLFRKIGVAVAGARGWPEGQGPEEERLAEALLPRGEGRLWRKGTWPQTSLWSLWLQGILGNSRHRAVEVRPVCCSSFLGNTIFVLSRGFGLILDRHA